MPKPVPKLLSQVRRKRRKDNSQSLQYIPGTAGTATKLIHADHKGGHAGIKAKALDILTNLLDRSVNSAKLSLSSRHASRQPFALIIHIKPPKLLKEAMHAFNALR